MKQKKGVKRGAGGTAMRGCRNIRYKQPETNWCNRTGGICVYVFVSLSVSLCLCVVSVGVCFAAKNDSEHSLQVKGAGIKQNHISAKESKSREEEEMCVVCV